MKDEVVFDELVNVVDLLSQVSGGNVVPSDPLSIPLIAGTSTVLQIEKSLNKSAFIKYTLFNFEGQRSGQIIINSFNDSVEFSELSTNDLGTSTNGITFDVSTDITNFNLVVNGVPDTSYTLKIYFETSYATSLNPGSAQIAEIQIRLANIKAARSIIKKRFDDYFSNISKIVKQITNI